MGNAAIDTLRHCFVCASIACSSRSAWLRFPAERFTAAPDQHQHNNLRNDPMARLSSRRADRACRRLAAAARAHCPRPRNRQPVRLSMPTYAGCRRMAWRVCRCIARSCRNGRVDPLAQPVIVSDRGAAVLVDGADGLAYPACDLAISTLIERARQFGSAVGGRATQPSFRRRARRICRRLARRAWSASRSATRPRPCPRGVVGARCSAPTRSPPSSRAVTRTAGDRPGALGDRTRQDCPGRRARGKPIPEGWATTRDGLPTTDARAALDGMMLPFGGAKGAMLALVVELLAAALTGANFGYRSRFVPDGGGRALTHRSSVLGDRSGRTGRRRNLSLACGNAD